MTDHIPNEIWADILYRAVAIPTKTFEAWSTPTSFAGTPKSSVTNILLVSGLWYDLAEPALYESAILRTKAQVRRFARSTSKDSEKGVKRASRVRHLRIEGGFGASLIRILGVARGIVTLFLGFNVALDDSFVGLKGALLRINPSRLFLQSTPHWHTTRPSTQSFFTAVGAALPGWTNLKRIDTSPQFVFWPQMVYPLKVLVALEAISMTAYTASHVEILNYIIENSSVRFIQIRDGANWLAWNLKRPRPYIPREKFVLGEGSNMMPWVDFALPFADPPAPRVKLPDLPDQIWTRILGFATHVHGYNYLDLDEELMRLSVEAKVNTTRLHVLLVNKRFYRLGLPHMYSIPHLRLTTTHGFVAQVNSSPELARMIRVLHITRQHNTTPSVGILSAPLTNLVRATDSGIRLLLDLDERIPAGTTSPLERAVQHFSRPAILALAPRNLLKFAHLRHLTIHGGRGAELDDVHPEALPRLERLGLIDPGPGMFGVFCSMSLPRLREFLFSTEPNKDVRGFLEAHGAKLDVLSLYGDTAAGTEGYPLLSLCPNATELHLVHCVNIPDKLPFVAAESAPHTALRRVVCPSFRIGVPGRQKEEWKRWDALIRFLEPHKHKLPALEEFRIFHLQWPLHESEYCSSPFVHLAQDLHALGIAFADRDGTRWTRLASTRYPVPRPTSWVTFSLFI